jgi:Flp pilus assembly protein TadG
MSGILRKFGCDRRGTVAMIFSFSLIPCFGVMGIAVDYMRAGMAHNKLQAAVDSAALAAGASDLTSQADLQKLIQNYIDVNSAGMTGFDVTKLVRSTNDNGDVIVKVDGTMKTAVMGIFGINKLDVAAQTRVSRAKGGRAEIALVLDTTGSMAGSKIATLKDAAKNLIADSLKANEGQATPLVKIGIVPFAQYVNVGVDRRNESWIDVPADYQTSSTHCRGWGWKQKCTTTYTSHTFSGCVGSRNYPYNLRDDSYTVNPVPGLMDITCSNEITDLTTNEATLDSAIDALSASGWTYIASGLTWGWRMVSPDAPLSQGISYEDMTKPKTRTKKFVILMTDGENTRAPSYPAHDSSDNTLANTLTADICTNIKDMKITVFTVAFTVTDPTTLDMLRTCASQPKYAFDAQDNAALVTSFKTISDQMSDLRLAE